MADKGLILFIHGLGGDAQGTWDRFPGLVQTDPRLAGYDVGFFEYPIVLGRDHRTVVKPDSHQDLTFEIFETFVLQRAVPATPRISVSDGTARYRVIAFDLDGTLICGLKFSWTLGWEYLRFPPDGYKAGMRRYLHGEHSYSEWCQWAVNMYRGKGLKREHFKEVVKGLKVTKNLHEALQILRTDDFIVGLIFGGIDVMLYETIPDADELFDHIFINQFQFDANGVVSGVEATPYDFDGKARALKKMCADHGYTLDRSVFEGEGLNDGHVSATAGLSIAYPPRDYELEAASHVLIEEDDLMKVVECVMAA